MPLNPHPTTRREGSGPSWGLGVGDAWGSREGETQGLPAFFVPFYTVCYYQIKVGNIQKKDHKEEEWVMEREAWRAPVHRVRKGRTGLSN